MSTIVPKEWHQPKYLVDQSGAASFDGGWIDTAGFAAIVMNVWWSAVAATAGTLALQGSNDAVSGVLPAPTAQSIVTLTVATPANGITTGLYGAQPAAGAAGAIMIVFARPPKLVRLDYVRSAGGGAAQFQAAWFARAT